MTYTVYILECSNGTFYTGSTGDLQKRLEAHQKGLDPKAYTYPLRPVKCVYAEEFPTKSQALDAERQIKGWSHAKKQALIEGDFEKIHQIVTRERRARENN